MSNTVRPTGVTHSDEEVDHEEDVEGQVHLLCGAGGPGMACFYL